MIDRPIAWFIPLCQPLHPKTILEEDLELSSRKNGLAIGTLYNLHHRSRMERRTTNIMLEDFKRFIWRPSVFRYTHIKL